MKARLLVTLAAGPSADPALVVYDNGKPFVPAGSVIDHPQVPELVIRGFAEPADDECAAAVKKSPRTDHGLARQVHDRIMSEYNETMAEVLEGEDDSE